MYQISFVGKESNETSILHSGTSKRAAVNFFKKVQKWHFATEVILWEGGVGGVIVQR